MTLNDARKVLGLAPEADPRPHLAEFRKARAQIAAMVHTAPNATLAARYQQSLVEFDQALAAIHEHPGSPDMPPPLPAKAGEETPVPSPAKTTVLGVAPAVPKPAAEESATREKSGGRALSILACVTVLLVAAVGVTWVYQQKERDAQDQRLGRIAALEREGATFVENRRWQEAAAKFSEIESIAPGSDVSARGRRSIEAGMNDEQTQFLGYWTGQASAELEAGRLDEAEAAARKLLEKFPEEKEAAAILEKIAAARAGQSRTAAIAAAREALNQRKWADAISTARQVLAKTPDDPDAKSIVADATAALDKSATDRAKAAELLKQAVARDNGQFDQLALDWLREAKSLDPENAEIASRLEKLSSYTRTLHVPGDFATPAEALENARDRDRIVLGAATWKGPLVVDVAVELQGAGFADTKIECRPEDGSAITIGPNAKGARISGISFRHEAFAAGTDRFSVALVRGGGAAFVDCRFTEASGHGLAVIEGGHATVSRSRFADNGWNGAAVIGKGSTLEVRDCESLNNFEHGIESWDGAAVTLVNNRCEGNSRNGIHADNGAASAMIEGNQLIANREFGLVLDSAGEGKVSGNTARGNLLGGIVIRAAAVKLPVTANQMTLNDGPGLVLEIGLPPADYTTNTAAQNTGQQILSAADLSGDPDKTPAPAAEIPRATIVTEPPPAKAK